MITLKINHKWLKLNQVIMYGLTKLKKTNTDKNINREDSLSIFFITFKKTFKKNKKFFKKVLTVLAYYARIHLVVSEYDKQKQ